MRVNLDMTRRYVAAIIRNAVSLETLLNDRQAGFVASHYRYFRHKRGMTATEAIKAARAIPAEYTKGREYYGPTGGAGAADSDGLRWIEDTGACGLRFLGDAESVAGRSAGLPTAYYAGDWMQYRPGVWQLPGKAGEARLVAGYREMEGDGEMNPGSARIDCSRVYRVDCRADWTSLRGTDDDARDAAQAAAEIARIAAERESEYQEAYARGQEAARLDNEAIEARKEALPILREMSLLKRSAGFRLAYGDKGADAPAIRAAVCARVESLLETISEKRAARDEAWGNCWRGIDQEPWLSGFMDEAAGQGFVRAVRLGWMKASDWQGKPEENPCYA